MKFFTPELYVQNNSTDADETDRAMEDWERAIKRYRRHYTKIKKELPDSIKFFYEHCCLHDADLFGPTWMSSKTVRGSLKNVALVVQNINTLQPEHLDTLMILQYHVVADPQVNLLKPEHPFGYSQSIWLYDELDLVGPGVFSHEIMVSDGRIIRLEFREFQLEITKLVAPSELDVKRRIVSAARAKRASA